MLFYAIGEKPITAKEAKKGVNYRCPECGGAVRLRGGKERKIHFYHLGSSHNCRQNGKSPTHLKIQQLLQKRLSAQLETPFPEIHRIADVYCPSRKMVVEVQCSPISSEEIEARNADYASLGLFVLWLFLDRRFSPKKSHFAFPHFFTTKEGEIYDYWEGKRFFVDLSQEISVRGKLPLFLQLRFKRWKRAFTGDLTHSALLKQLPLRRLSFLQKLFTL